MTTTNENAVEVLDQPLTRADLIQRLHDAGHAPSAIAEAADVTLELVRTVITRRTPTPGDDELQEAWAGVERDVVRFIRKTMRVGTQTDKMALAKVVAGRLLAKRGVGEADSMEEYSLMWSAIREEQRGTAQDPDNLRHLPQPLDYDDDEGEY